MRPFLPYLLIALLIALLAALVASSYPDGLERIAELLGFKSRATLDPVLKSPLPDYSLPGMEEGPLATALAGIVGALICFILPFGFFLLRKK